MGWNASALRRPRRRSDDRREPAPASVPAPGRGGAARKSSREADPWTVLAGEIDRSRRYRHRLTLVRLVPDESSAAPVRREGRPGHRRDIRRRDLLAGLRAIVRSGDVAWADGGALFVLMPETDAAAAESFVVRARATLPQLADAQVRLASFPEDGLTGQALRAAVTARERRLRPSGARARTAESNGNGDGHVRGPATPVADREWRSLGERLPGPVSEGAD